jgi:hypothetical protein
MQQYIKDMKKEENFNDIIDLYKKFIFQVVIFLLEVYFPIVYFFPIFPLQ